MKCLLLAKAVQAQVTCTRSELSSQIFCQTWLIINVLRLHVHTINPLNAMYSDVHIHLCFIMCKPHRTHTHTHTGRHTALPHLVNLVIAVADKVSYLWGKDKMGFSSSFPFSLFYLALQNASLCLSLSVSLSLSLSFSVSLSLALSLSCCLSVSLCLALFLTLSLSHSLSLSLSPLNDWSPSAWPCSVLRHGGRNSHKRSALIKKTEVGPPAQKQRLPCWVCHIPYARTPSIKDTASPTRLLSCMLKGTKMQLEVYKCLESCVSV